MSVLIKILQKWVELSIAKRPSYNSKTLCYSLNTSNMTHRIGYSLLVYLSSQYRVTSANGFLDDPFGGDPVMVWARISAQGEKNLHVIDMSTLTALRYVNEILDVYVRPYAGAVGENFILMDDNARAHRARITDQYLEQATIVSMEWPARSPELNPIEHAWDMLQAAVSSRPVQPASVQELRQALLEEWDQIPQYKIRRLISSMRRRCQAVIEARGHHTRY